MSDSRPTSSSQARLTFAGGGWVLVVAGVLMAGVVLWGVLGVILGERPVGDGKHIKTYGFDLNTLTVDRDLVAATGNSKDFLKPLDQPPTTAVEGLKTVEEQMRGSHLVSDDRVIGVEIAGRARAYPLRMLNAHEIVNDTLAGTPIAVTYSPLCDAAVVFDRRVNGATLSFGISGMLYNSNLLMYDRTEEEQSLWSQLRARAIAGPAAEAGETLTILTCSLARWGDWMEAYPQTTVLAPNPAMRKRYKKTNYDLYFGSDELSFPVEPSIPEVGPQLKERIVAVRDNQQWRVYQVETLVDLAVESEQSRVEVTEDVTFFVPGPESIIANVRSENDGELPEIVHAFWFAFHAMWPEAELVEREAIVQSTSGL